MKLYIEPKFRGPDQGEGGIRRIVEAQEHLLPSFDVELVERIEDADCVATHAGSAPDVPVGIPWIVHNHGLYWSEYKWPKWCHDLNSQVIESMRRADIVTAPSEWVAQAIRRGMWLEPEVLYHGIYPDEWEPGENVGYVLWNKTRVDPVCDPEPVDRLASMAPDLHFVTTFGKEMPNVQVTGRLPYSQAKRIIQGAGVYLCTTRETMGIGTLEAMACGVPVVGWDWGGQKEFITNEETGWLVPVGDYAQLHTAIKWALDNREAVGERARQLVLEAFTWPTIMAEYAALYRRAVAAHQERQAAPKVSVVMPCYNLAQYLPDAIQSVQAQSITNWELIVVDDASPDNTKEVVEAYSKDDERIRLVSHSENRYLAEALNTGVGESRGRYILPLDADNMIGPDTLRTLSGALDKARDIHIAYGRCQFVLEDGRTPDTSVSPDGISGWPKDFRYQDQIRERNQIPSTAMYRREVWERSGGYRGRWKTSEDADFWTRVSSIGFRPYYATRSVTLIYRQREDSMSRQHEVPNYANWYPWSRDINQTPFGAAMVPPSLVNEGLSWHVPSAEPVHVAVIIPVGKGHERIVQDAVDSVYAQTYAAWECVVVNDTGGPIKGLPSWVNLIQPEVPPYDDGAATPKLISAGPAASRNVGIRASSAPLLLFLDADDYLQPDALELMVAVWREHGGVVYSQWMDEFMEGQAKVYDPPEYDAHLLTAKGAIHAVTALYPRDKVVEVGLFEEGLSHWEDWDMQLLLASIGVCGTKIAKPLFTYRKHTGFRREDNNAAFEKGKEALMSKWPKLWDGGEKLMGCTGCPGGGGARLTQAPAPVQQHNPNVLNAEAPSGWAFLRYSGVRPETRTYRGPSGRQYRFGANRGNNVRLVETKDLPHFLSLTEAGAGVIFEQAETATGQAPSSPAITAPTFVAPLPSEPQAISEAVSVDGNALTIAEMRKTIPTKTTEELVSMLEDERRGSNRASAVKILQDTIQRRET